MRRTISVIAGTIILVLVLGQLFLPALLGNRLASQLKDATNAENVDVSMTSFPAFRLLAGEMDSVHIVVDNAMLNDLQVTKLTLDGEKVQADFSAFSSHDGSAIRSADNLQMTGVITAEALQNLLIKRLDGVDELHATMDKEKVTASGQTKLLGRMADIHLEGTVLVKNGGLYFHMTQLDIRNAILGSAVVGNFFGDVLLFDFYNSPVHGEIVDVEQQDGQVVIQAELQQ